MPATPLPESLETERLLLRPLRDDDLDFFVALHGDAEVMTYMGGDGNPRPPEVTREWLAKMQRWYREDHVGPYAVVRKADECLVGRCGISYFEMEAQPSSPDGLALASWGKGSLPPETEKILELEVGYVIHPDHQRQGYATEAASAWMRFAFEERGEPHVISLISPHNAPSLRVAEKNGLLATRRVSMDGNEYIVFRMQAPS